MECKVITAFFETVDAINESEKLPKSYGSEYMLYHAESNLLTVVCKNPESPANELAERLGVTRGAITQMSNKLEEKGLIEKYSKSDNKKKKYYRLTEAGENIVKAQNEYHSHANKQMCMYLRKLGEDEQKIIIDFLGELNGLIPISLFDCSSHVDCGCVRT